MMKLAPRPVHLIDFAPLGDGHFRFKCRDSGETGQHFNQFAWGGPLSVWDDKNSRCEVANVDHVNARKARTK
jgi:hypothetical protein